MKIKLNNNKILEYHVVDPRDIVIYPNNHIIDEKTSITGEINSLVFNNNYTISVGDSLQHKIANTEYTRKYKVNAIIFDNEKYILTEEKELISNYFLLPSVITGEPDKYNRQALINCYLDTNIEGWKNRKGLLYLKYRLDPFEAFITMDTYFESKPNYINKILLDGFIVYVFKILKVHLKDVTSYLSNNYNAITMLYSKKIIKTFNLKESDLIYRLFFDRENKKKKKIEYWGWNEKDDIPLFTKPISPILTI